jgi:hypothetical protein
MVNKEKECCPKFDFKLWDNKTHKWDKKKFIKETMPTFFHTPFPWIINKKMWKMYNLIMASKAGLPNKEWLILFRDPSAFKTELYSACKKPVKDAENVTISGTFMSRVFDGPYSHVPKFLKKMEEFLASKNKKAKDYYIHYAYCPKCSKKYGHNYMIFFAKIK